MKLIAALAILCASCVSNPDAETHRLALRNFHYIADNADEYLVYDYIDSIFYGDCEDFAFTLQRVIGGDVWHVARGSESAHAALVKGGIVYDSLSRYPVLMNRYSGDFLFIMKTP